MTQDIIQYIRNNYWKINVLTSKERDDFDKIHHINNYHFFRKMALENISNSNLSNEEERLIKENFNLQDFSDEDFAIYNENYQSRLISKIANRIMNLYRDEIFFNRCPVCNVLARTPDARQCKHGHRWDDYDLIEDEKGSKRWVKKFTPSSFKSSEGDLKG